VYQRVCVFMLWIFLGGVKIFFGGGAVPPGPNISAPVVTVLI